jgi:PAS domain S-box-containing protein
LKAGNTFYNALMYFLSAWLLLLMQNTCFAEDILSPAERLWLQSHPEIRVAVSPDYAPVNFLNEHGKLVGLGTDYLKLVEKRLGVKFKQVVLSVPQMAAKRPAEKKVDMILTFAITDERLQYWNFTKTYLDFPVYIITRKDAPINFSLENTPQSVSVVGHYAVYDYLVKQYPKLLIDKVDDTCVGLQDVSFGVSVGMLSDLPVANWCASKHGLKNLKILNALDFHYKMSIATRKDWPILSGILDKGLNAITQKERDEIYTRWNKNGIEQNKFEQYKYWIFAIILSLTMALIYRLFQWDKRLKNALDKRLSNTNISDTELVHRAIVSKEVMRSNIFAFMGILTIIFTILAFSYHYFQKNQNISLGIIELLAICIGLLVSYILGGMQSRFEADGYFSQFLNQANKREVVEKKMDASEDRLQKQQRALTTLTKHQLKDWQDIEEHFREIVEVSAETLEVERVSIWLSSDDEKQLECKTLYLKSQNSHSVEKSLLAKELPEYFKHLSRHRVIAVDDAMRHPATAELTNGYLQEANIGAMLDGTIWLNNKVIGVICHEHVGSSREWTLDEQSFVGSLADLARLTIETYKRRNAEHRLQKYTEELEQIVNSRTKSLQESEQRFSSVLKYAAIPISSLNMNGEIVEFNPESERVTGYKRSEVLGKNFIDLFVVKESLKKTLLIGINARKGRDTRDIELLFRCADGRDVEFLCNIVSAKQGASEDERRMIAVAQDITQQKALQTSLIRAREAAESADRIKSMFVASMSHELRTPLNSIIGFLGVVLQGMSGELNLKQKDQLGRAYHSAKHLLSLISDVIDISKIEAGFLNVYAEKFDLSTLLSDVEHSVGHILEEKYLDLRIITEGEINLETDRKRLYQVVLNVVSNAIKYTEKGSVQVYAKVKRKQLIIEVVDTGIGIDEAGLDRLFKPFERVESRLKIKTLGTGLGLYLTHKILTQLLGGKIEVQSKLDVGSTFTIVVPIKLPEEIIKSNFSKTEGSHLD